ncbi:MAG: HAMP domain-containing histidine kinase [Caulobacteraceae bacterium]|nr:HAMP domain-containing histidine kinase [Caulobacteraceae bacterium]
MADAPTQPDHGAPARRMFWPGGLSARLLVITAAFVAVLGAIFLPPALAAFERQWLLDRVRSAELATLVTDAAPEGYLDEARSRELLRGAGVAWVAIEDDGIRRLVLQGPRLDRTPYVVDLRDRALASWLAAPFQTLTSGRGRMVRVLAEPRFRQADFIEIVAPDAELKAALTTYLWRILGVTLIVAGGVGGLVYLSLNLFLVRPMQRITLSMERFRADPDDPLSHIEPSHRRDEIGRAELELDRMQADLRAALNSRARLAALGEAVAKITHDLRNMLTSAQLASERLAAIGDPQVARALPRLERALNRATRLSTEVLAYGKTEEAAPEAQPTPLLPALEAAAEEAGLGVGSARLEAQVAAGAQMLADPDQLHRILVNLMRNARQAIAGQAGRAEGGRVSVHLSQDAEASRLRIGDDGPGVPPKARERLFQPFGGSTNPEGAGLGLAIARELAQGHGGDLTLVETGPGGTVFELMLPGAPAPVKARRARPAVSPSQG